MKKIITVAALLAGAVSAYSQGQLAFSDYGGSYQVFFYNVQAANTTPITYGGFTTMETSGNGATYTGGKLSGTGFSIQVLAGAGNGDTLSQLSPYGAISGFYTGGLAGLFTATVSDTMTNTTLDTGVAPGPATIALAAWANTGSSGSALTLAAAQADHYAWGISTLANLTLTTTPTTPPAIPAGVQSFSLGTTPEPSTIALGVIGASAFLMRLRRKQ
jgi:hypothetical protein